MRASENAGGARPPPLTLPPTREKKRGVIAGE